MSKNYLNTNAKYYTVALGTVQADRDLIVKMAENVKTEAEYVLFVREWRTFYKDITGVVRDARSTRQDYKASFEGDKRFEACSYAHTARQVMRPIGKQMSELRVDMKVKLFNGSIEKQPAKELETA